MAKKRSTRGWWMTLTVLLSATVLTTLTIFASDTLRIPGESRFSQLAALVRSESGPCPPEMVFVDSGTGGYCIDMYEASASSNCPKQVVTGTLDTELNLTSPTCSPLSVKGAAPWAYVAVHQAESLCAKVGKRLPTNQEWYRAGIGTPDSDSVCALGRIGESVSPKTGNDGCRSSVGAFDMIGNVWEWVGETVTEGELATKLPSDGYVSEINDKGIPTRTSSTSDVTFGEDYFFLDPTGVRGMFRGGFWSMQERAGIYSVNVTMSPSFQGSAVGFRCAKSARVQ